MIARRAAEGWYTRGTVRALRAAPVRRPVERGGPARRSAAVIDLLAVASLVLVAATVGLVTWTVLQWPVADRRAGQPAGCHLRPHPGTRRIRTTSPTACDAALEGGASVGEVVVYDDRSTDDTAARVRAIADRHDGVRLIRGAALPDGWCGKPFACAELARAATRNLAALPRRRREARTGRRRPAARRSGRTNRQHDLGLAGARHAELLGTSPHADARTSSPSRCSPPRCRSCEAIRRWRWCTARASSSSATPTSVWAGTRPSRARSSKTSGWRSSGGRAASAPSASTAGTRCSFACTDRSAGSGGLPEELLSGVRARVGVLGLPAPPRDSLHAAVHPGRDRAVVAGGGRCGRRARDPRAAQPPLPASLGRRRHASGGRGGARRHRDGLVVAMPQRTRCGVEGPQLPGPR